MSERARSGKRADRELPIFVSDNFYDNDTADRVQVRETTKKKHNVKEKIKKK